MSWAGTGDFLYHIVYNWAAYRFHYRTDELYGRVMANPEWLPLVEGLNGFLNPEVALLEIPGANAVATARGLALTFNRLASGQLLSQATVDQIRAPMFTGDVVDLVTGLYTAHGHGFQYFRRPNGHVSRTMIRMICDRTKAHGSSATWAWAARWSRPIWRITSLSRM